MGERGRRRPAQSGLRRNHVDRDAQQPVIVYLYGGAYLLPPAKQHWLFLDRLAQRSGARILVPDYPHLPEASAQDALAYLRRLSAALADQMIPPERYLARLGDEQRRPNALRYEDTDVYAILATSANVLAEQQPTLVQHWQMLGVCPAPFDAAAASARIVWSLSVSASAMSGDSAGSKERTTVSSARRRSATAP